MPVLSVSCIPEGYSNQLCCSPSRGKQSFNNWGIKNPTLAVGNSKQAV